MASIRCHTVPQFYLDYFLPEKSSSFWVYNKKDFKSRQQQPINTTVIGDYYLSLPDATGEKDKRMEDFFSKIEGNAKLTFDKIIQKPTPLKLKDKEILAIFLSFAFCRVPRAIETAKAIGEVSLDRIIEITKEESKNKKKLEELYNVVMQDKKEVRITLKEFRKLIQNCDEYFNFSINEKHCIGWSLELAEDIFHCLMNMKWSMYIAKEKLFFITCDAPVNVFMQTGEGKAIFGGGFGQPNVQVSFPINPKICLFLTYSSSEEIKKMGYDFVNEMNRRAVRMAQQYVISPFKSNKIKRLMSELGNNFDKPKIDVDYFQKRFKNRIRPSEKEDL